MQRSASPQFVLDKAWLEESTNQLVRYRDKIGCPKHESIALLLVKPRDKQSKNCKQPMFVLPGGKRDLKAFKQTEPCWEAIVREFQEEVDEDLNMFCRKKCRFFEESTQVNVDLNMVTDTDLKEVLLTDSNKQIERRTVENQELSDHNGSKDESLSPCPLKNDERNLLLEIRQDERGLPLESLIETKRPHTQITRRIRSYFVEVECNDIPNKSFGRFNLYEMTERKWFQLEDMVQQFKSQHTSNKFSMTISPKMFKCISRFGGKIVNIQQKQLQKLNFVYQINQNTIPIDEHSTDLQQIPLEQTQDFLNYLIDKINRTHTLFAKINNSIKKQPIVLKMGQDILYF